MTERRRIGINIASLFPWSFGPGGPKRAWAIADQAGFDGLQIMPMRGWAKPEEEIPQEAVLSYEDAWNTGPLHRALLRTIGRLDHPEPTIKDWLLFGSDRQRCHDWVLRTSRHFKPAIYSQHSFSGWWSQPVEAHPELSRSPDEYLAYPGGLVWDTRHVRRLGKDGALPPVTDDWRQLLVNLADHNQIRLIHVNPMNGELDEALYQRPSDFTEMLRLLIDTTGPNVPVIFELTPKPLWSGRKLASYLADIRGVLQNDYFDTYSPER